MNGDGKFRNENGVRKKVDDHTRLLTPFKLHVGSMRWNVSSSFPYVDGNHIICKPSLIRVDTYA